MGSSPSVVAPVVASPEMVPATVTRVAQLLASQPPELITHLLGLLGAMTVSRTIPNDSKRNTPKSNRPRDGVSGMGCQSRSS
jgi:hypothetical protein